MNAGLIEYAYHNGYNKGYSIGIKHNAEDILQLESALDKACTILAEIGTFDKETWKSQLMNENIKEGESNASE